MAFQIASLDTSNKMQTKKTSVLSRFGLKDRTTVPLRFVAFADALAALSSLVIDSNSLSAISPHLGTNVKTILATLNNEISETTMSCIKAATAFMASLLPRLSETIAGLTPAVIQLKELVSFVFWHPFESLSEGISLLVYSLFFLPPLVKLISIGVILYTTYSFICWVGDKYQEYLDLGRGGTPSTFTGFYKVSFLKHVASIDVLTPPHVPPMLEPYRGMLESFPNRQGIRPIVKGVAPQRQFDQKAPRSTFDRLLNMMREYANANPTDLMIKTSYLEKYTPALRKFHKGTDDEPLIPGPDGNVEMSEVTEKVPIKDEEGRVISYKTEKRLVPKLKFGEYRTDREWGYEIAHPHRNDGSLHMVLHPEDVKVVIEQGWGERHPLCAHHRLHWRHFNHFWRSSRTPVPEYLVLVYAPRNEYEFQIVAKLLEAAVWFAFGGEKNLREGLPFDIEDEDIHAGRPSEPSVSTKSSASIESTWVDTKKDK